MKLRVQVVIEHDEASSGVAREVFSLERGSLGPASIGIALAEVEAILGALQERVVSGGLCTRSVHHC